MVVEGVTMKCSKCKSKATEGLAFDDFTMRGPEPVTLVEVFICKACLDKARERSAAEYGPEVK